MDNDLLIALVDDFRGIGALVGMFPHLDKYDFLPDDFIGRGFSVSSLALRFAPIELMLAEPPQAEECRERTLSMIRAALSRRMRAAKAPLHEAPDKPENRHQAFTSPEVETSDGLLLAMSVTAVVFVLVTFS
jgi:hypothetical protein